MRDFHLHLVSDATGETLSGVARACLVQFEDVHPIEYHWSLIRTETQVERVLAGIKANPGMVLFTLVDPVIRALLEKGCRDLKVPSIPVLDPVIGALSGHLGGKFRAEPGRQYVLDAEYFRRIDAMQFTLAHDDGQGLYDIDTAQIILVGVSRTSKTPTSMYLANRGLKVANVPLISGLTPPEELIAARGPLIVGLTRAAESLSDIRQSRLKFLGRQQDGNYADIDHVKDEVAWARKIFARHGWPVIDVTQRSIEEASAAILQLYASLKGKPA